jgi:hypothetical protein
MDDKTQAATQMLEQLSFVNVLRDTLGSAKVIAALRDTSNKEWDNCKDANTGDHLIKGIFQSTQKGDAVRIYIAKVMAQYMRSVGARANAWTKNTIAAENFTNTSISNRISAAEFQEADELFKIVATRLIGFDDGVIDFVVAKTPKAKAEALVVYLASRFDLAESPEKAAEHYAGIIDLFSVKFEGDGFDELYFLKTVGQVISYYSYSVGEELKLTNPFDVLEMLESEADYGNIGEMGTVLAGGPIEVIIDKDDPDPQVTIDHVRAQWANLDVRVVMPDGNVVEFKKDGSVVANAQGPVEVVAGADEGNQIRSTLIG